MPSFLKLTLRDLLWLALLMAGLTAWGIQHSRTTEQVTRWKNFVGRQDFGPSAAAKQRQAALARFEQFTDQQLDDELAAFSKDGSHTHGPDFEPCLTEMARRGLADRLQKHYEALLARDKSQDVMGAFWYNLEVLTALRRAQRRPDPLRIDVTVLGLQESLVEGKPAPRIRATLTSADIGQETIRLQHSGDYRGGRLERWRIVLTDERGRAQPDSNFVEFDGGGISTVVPLQPGEQAQYQPELDLRAHLAPPPPGKYTLQVIYHNDQCIAGETDLSGLIVSRSEPIAVVIDRPANPFQDVQSGHQMAIAVLIANGIMLLIARLSGAPRKTAPPRRTIPLRDRIWCCLLLLVAAAISLDYDWQARRMLDKSPHVQARWTIAPAQK